MIEGLRAEEEGQTDLKEADMRPDGASGFFHQPLVSMRPWVDSRAPFHMFPFSSGARVLPIGRCDEVSQIDQMPTMQRGNSGRFDMVEG